MFKLCSHLGKSVENCTLLLSLNCLSRPLNAVDTVLLEELAVS